MRIPDYHHVWHDSLQMLGYPVKLGHDRFLPRRFLLAFIHYPFIGRYYTERQWLREKENTSVQDNPKRI
jgi:hypothetical protein